MRKLFALVRPLEVYSDNHRCQTVKKGQPVWAETPLDAVRVLVYLDERQFWAHRLEFEEATLSPESPRRQQR
jgi:hypothetical protein